MSALAAAAEVFKRELRLAQRRRADSLLPIVFFVLVISLFAIALGPNDARFLEILPATVWVAVLLATTIKLDRLYLDDYRNGIIEQFCLTPYSLALVVLAKIGAHWLTSAAPQIIIAVVLAKVLNQPNAVLIALGASLLLGSPILSLVGSIASALTAGLRGGAMLIALITLPLYMPTLIFGTAAVHNARLGLPIAAELYFLAGLTIMTACLAPFASAAALRIRLS